MKLSCPTCSAAIPASQINVETDVAACSQCDEAFSVSDLVAAGRDDSESDELPPHGVWMEEDFDRWSIGASTRSFMALFLIPFTCVWSGFSLTGIYGSQLAAGKFDPMASLFGLPFLIGTVVLVSMTLMYCLGKVVVTVDQNQGRVFTGVGPIGWTRSFDWQTIRRVEEVPLGYQTANGYSFVLSLVGDKRLKFGSLLSESRREFVLHALRKQLRQRSK